jgi:hypothetical protein
VAASAGGELWPGRARGVPPGLLARRPSRGPGRTTPFLRTYAVLGPSAAVAADNPALQSGSVAHAAPRRPPRGAVTASPISCGAVDRHVRESILLLVPTRWSHAAAAPALGVPGSARCAAPRGSVRVPTVISADYSFGCCGPPKADLSFGDKWARSPASAPRRLSCHGSADGFTAPSSSGP